MRQEVLKLVSPIPPSVNHYLATRAILRGGKPLAVTYTTNEAKRFKRDFKEYVAAECQRQDWRWTPNKYQHFYIDTVYYFPRTDMDPGNYQKTLFDAITETQLIWLDDNVALERVQGVYYDKQNPRIELCIRPVDYIGVFNDASQLAAFEANCLGCTRYTRNCSLLKRAKEGRIQNEIQNGVCSAFKTRTKKETEL